MAVVLITGASSGIGAALAQIYADKGYDLALLARRHERLQTVANDILRKHPTRTVFTVRCDVAQKTDVDNALAAILQKFKGLDVVIANAGIGMGGTFENLGVDKYRAIFEINVVGVLHTVGASLQALKNSQGRLAVIGSVNSYLSLPRSSAYCMSKAAVKAWCDSVRPELKPHGISVTLICPGLVESEIRGAGDRAPKWLVMRADKAARQMFRAIESRKIEQVVTLHGKVLIFLQRHVPALTRFLASRA